MIAGKLHFFWPLCFLSIRAGAYTSTKADFFVFGSSFLSLCWDTGVVLECDFS